MNYIQSKITNISKNPLGPVFKNLTFTFFTSQLPMHFHNPLNLFMPSSCIIYLILLHVVYSLAVIKTDLKAISKPDLYKIYPPIPTTKVINFGFEKNQQFTPKSYKNNQEYVHLCKRSGNNCFTFSKLKNIWKAFKIFLKNLWNKLTRNQKKVDLKDSFYFVLNNKNQEKSEHVRASRSSVDRKPLEKSLFSKPLVILGKKYKLNPRPLGEGSYGVAFEALDSLGNHVVVKFFKPTSSLHDDFINEAEALKKTNRLEAADFTKIILVQKFITGTPLDEILTQKLDIEEKQRLFGQYMSLVEDFAKKNEMVHGDIRPWNVLVDKKNNEMILIDFGMTRPLSSDSEIAKNQIADDKEKAIKEWRYLFIHQQGEKALRSPQIENARKKIQIYANAMEERGFSEESEKIRQKLIELEKQGKLM